MKEWHRNCPHCETQINYAFKGDFTKAERKASVCKKCSLKLYPRKKTRYWLGKKRNFLNERRLSWIRNCPDCNVDIEYLRQSNYCRANRVNSVCISCRAKKVYTTERNSKVSKSLSGRNLSLDHIESLRNGHIHRTVYASPMKGKTHSNETKQKLRDIAIKNMDTRSGGGLIPFYNSTACKIFDDINREFNWNGVHAENGGEFKVGRYWVDYYEPARNLVIEYDEPHHRYQTAQDKEREMHITKKLNCQFMRIASIPIGKRC